MPDTHDPGAPTLLAPGGTNAIGRMLGLLGDEWNLHIIRQALLSATRYSQFMSQLAISNSVLTNRLQTLVNSELLARKLHESTRARTEYLTTPRSRSLWTVLLSIWAWERNWIAEHPDQLPDVRHLSCGRSFMPVLTCSNCHTVVEADNSLMQLGPSGTWDRSTPAAVTRRRSDPARQDGGLFPETMSMFGNRWAAALVLAAFLGTTRFTDFQTQLGAPPSLLAERLQTFCGLGILTTLTDSSTSAAQPIGPERSAYLLTDKGRAFFPVLVAALQWAQHWYLAPEGPAMTLTHMTCGAEFIGELSCDQCAQVLTRDQLSAGIT